MWDVTEGHNFLQVEAKPFLSTPQKTLSTLSELSTQPKYLTNVYIW